MQHARLCVRQVTPGSSSPRFIYVFFVGFSCKSLRPRTGLRQTRPKLPAAPRPSPLAAPCILLAPPVSRQAKVRLAFLFCFASCEVVAPHSGDGSVSHPRRKTTMNQRCHARKTSRCSSIHVSVYLLLIYSEISMALTLELNFVILGWKVIVKNTVFRAINS